MDRLTALNVFRRAADLGSFAAAARGLGLSPAAVSKNVAELEADLGVRLFNRTTRQMSLTEEGARYYERVARALDDLAEADRALGPMQRVPSGLLRVTAPVTLTLLTSISRCIPKFLERYPELSLDLRLDDRRVDIVEEGLDVAIRGMARLEDSSLTARRLMTTRYVVCASPSYLERHGAPLTPEELRAHNCLQYSLAIDPDEWRFSRAGRAIRVPVAGRYKASSSLALREALRAGFGLSLIPEIYVRDDVKHGHLRCVLDEWSAGELSIYAIYPSRRHLSVKVRAFVDFLVEELSGKASQ